MEYNAWNTLRCKCYKCGSYPGVIKELRRQHMPGVYCAKGASRLEVIKKGCDCPKCMVYKNHGLREEYYCIQGKAKVLYPDKKDRVVVTHEKKAPVTAVSN
jgi:hypothetical protein